MEEEQLTYKQFIEAILEGRGHFGCGEEYHERHHIIPRCLGGGSEDSNLIDLYPKEHFMAHKLLAQENPKENKLQYAWWQMSNCIGKDGKRYKCTPEEYEEAKIAMAKAMSGKNNPMFGKSKEMSPVYGRKHTLEEREKMSEARKGVIVSDITRQKLSELNKGENNPNYGKEFTLERRNKISEALKGEKNYWYGKHFSEEHRKKISEANSGEKNWNWGKHLSEEQKRKMSESFGGAKHWNCRAVRCVETGKIYWGAKEAENILHIDSSSITACCKGRRKTAGGYHWEYVEDNKVDEQERLARDEKEEK